MRKFMDVDINQLNPEELERLVDECVGSMSTGKMPTSSACQCGHIDPEVVRIPDEDLALA